MSFSWKNAEGSHKFKSGESECEVPLGHLGEAQESGRELERTGERILGQSYVGVGCGQSSCGGGVCPGRQDGGWREKFQCLPVCVITRGAFPKRGRCWEVKNLRPGKPSFSKGRGHCWCSSEPQLSSVPHLGGRGLDHPQGASQLSIIPESHHGRGMLQLLPGPAPHLHLTASSGYVLGSHSWSCRAHMWKEIPIHSTFCEKTQHSGPSVSQF